jgi:hypothetical protein
MKPEQIVEALENAAATLEVKVRYEALGPSGVTGSGGLCKVRGEWWLIMDKKTTPAERVALLADALARFDTDRLELPPRARDALTASRRAAQSAEPRPVNPPPAGPPPSDG